MLELLDNGGKRAVGVDIDHREVYFSTAYINGLKSTTITVLSQHLAMIILTPLGQMIKEDLL